MGQVIPFIARVRDSGDWSETERARLEELADRLADTGVKVEVTFGASDEGDPWCVVTDENGDVLIHVARIGGTFVVHSALDDSLNEGADLHAALRDQLNVASDWGAPAPSAEILPFEARRAQTLLALVAAAAFFYETADPTPVHAAEPPRAPEAPHEPVAPPPQDLAASDDRELAIKGAAVSDKTHDEPQAAPVLLAHDQDAPIAPAPAASPAPEPEPEAARAAPALEVHALAETPQAAAPEPPHEIRGTSGDDLLVGTARSEVLLGGDGNDTLQGGGGHDTLDGGAGDDRIELTAGVLAIGGKGADTFVIKPPPAFGHPDQMLGHIFDFSQLEGDRVVTWRGDHVPLPLGAGDGAGHTGPATFTTTTRVDVDLDGDGKIDGYLVFGHDSKPPPTPEPPPPPDGDHPITIVGHSLDWHHDPGT